MKDRTCVLLITPLAIAALFATIYNLRKQGATAKEIKLIRQNVERNLAETQAIHHDLRVSAAPSTRCINTCCRLKRTEKSHLVNHLQSMAGSHDLAVP
ncbi:MAG: hypothetical protein WBD45_09015 [Terriglobales bacterium]